MSFQPAIEYLKKSEFLLSVNEFENKIINFRNLIKGKSGVTLLFIDKIYHSLFPHNDFEQYDFSYDLNCWSAIYLMFKDKNQDGNDILNLANNIYYNHKDNCFLIPCDSFLLKDYPHLHLEEFVSDAMICHNPVMQFINEEFNLDIL